jgi:tRNA threonylcarbamoyl adenosine modification protein YeaZ
MLLAIDTASRKIGIALYDGVEVLHETIWYSHSHHTSELTPAIEAALEKGGNTIEEIEVIAVSIGPGSYTGLRIGAAVAKGLALAHRLPMIAIPTFDVLAAAQPVREDLHLAVVLEAGRERLAVEWYKPKEGAWISTNRAALFTPGEFNKKISKPTLICGERWMILLKSPRFTYRLTIRYHHEKR